MLNMLKSWPVSQKSLELIDWVPKAGGGGHVGTREKCDKNSAKIERCGPDDS